MSSDQPSGEAIAAAAYALPPLAAKGLGAGVEGISIALAVLTTIVVALRVWVRSGFSGMGAKAWGLDDYLVVIGFLPFLPSVIFSCLATHYGLGLEDVDIPNALYQVRAAEYIIIWEINYFVSSTIVKCAIGCACLRIDTRKQIRYPIIINMFIMVLVAILALVFVFANCKPLAATWNPYLGTCQKAISLETVSYIVSSIQMATDWTCAIIPWFIVSDLQMSRRRKASIMVILGLGVLASIATCVRMPYLKYYDTTKYPDNFLHHVGPIVICSNVECSFGIIACSLPPLRKLFKTFYGSSSNNSRSRITGKSGSYGAKLSSLTPRGKYKIGIVGRAETNGQWDTIDDDDSSRKGIMRRVDVSVVSAR